MDQTNHYVVVKGLSKHFGASKVFEDLSFAIEEGEFITLLGPSGCGKSTLLRCLAGLETPDAGSIFVNGEDITHTKPQKRGIGMVFQSYALFPNMTAAENIAFGLKMQGLEKNEILHRVAQAIRTVELTNNEKKYPNQLSGGQRQRVALARALVVKPRILLLDEPLSALDARIRRNLRDEIRSIQREMQLTTIFVTHDQEEAMTMSDRIFLMNKGQFVQMGTPEEVYLSPATEFAARFIGSYNLLTKEQAAAIFDVGSEELYAVRPEVRSLELASKMYDQKVNVTRSEFLPSLALMGSYMATSPSVLNSFEKKFKGMWNVGVMLSVPIWHWGEGIHKVKAAKAEARIARYQLADAKEKIELQVNQSAFKVNEAAKKLVMAEKNLEKANENLRYATLGFEEGVIPASNVLEAHTAWLSAQSEKIDAQIDVKLTDLYLKRATGRLFNEE